MKQIVEILTRKKLQLFFLFYIVLALPVFACFAQNLTWGQIALMLSVNILLFGAISIVCTFCSPKLEKFIYLLLFFVALIPGLIYIGYLLFAGVYLQHHSTISLFETNPEESKEFIVHYFNRWLALGQTLYVLLCLCMIWKMKSIKRLLIYKHKTAFWTALTVIILIIAIPYLSRQVYFYNFYKLFVDYKLRLNFEEQAIADRQEFEYEVICNNSDTTKQTLIVVIGESLTRHHMSLYGYPRTTNPELEKLGDSLHTYKDVISPQVHTIPVIRSVLTLSEQETPDEVVDKPSLFELFNRAGYETYFITNQTFGGNFKTSFDSFLNLAHSVHNVSTQKQPDGVILPVLKDILNQKSDKNRIVLIHLIGNHMAYEFRYTPNFSVFDHTKDALVNDSPFRDREAKSMIDRYDNSVLYNDYIISQIINYLKDQPNSDTGLIYFSDHGEEIYDTRAFAGHAYEKVSTYMCEIPFLVWMSPNFKDKRRDLIFDENRPFSTANFLYSLSDLAGISYKDYKDNKSIFSRDFKKEPRYIGDLTYEEVIERSK